MQATVGDLDSPGMADGAEDQLLVVPPDPAHLEAAQRATVEHVGST